MTIDEAITTEIECSQPCDIICKYGADCNDCRSYHRQLAEWLEELKQYRQIGTVQECKEAVGKMRPKEPWKDRENNLRSCDYEWKCPICGHIVGDDEDTYFCKHCGQKVWG